MNFVRSTKEESDAVDGERGVEPVPRRPTSAGSMVEPYPSSRSATAVSADSAAAPSVLQGEALEWVLQLERLAQAGFLAGGLANGVLDALTAIAGTCQIGLLDRDPERLRDSLDRATALAMRAAEATNVFLTFARAGATARLPSPCDGVVEDALRFLAPALRSARAEVDVEIEDGLRVACDRTRLMQVVVDSVLLLLRTGGQDGLRLRVRARREGDEAVVRVASDGPALSEEASSTVFEPFLRGTGRRAGASQAEAVPGLFLARRIVEEVGGRLQVDAARDRHVTVAARLPRASSRASEPKGSRENR